MKNSLTYLLLVSVILVLGGFGCNRKTNEVMVEEPSNEQSIATPDILPPPPEVIADIKQEGFSDSQKEYYDVIKEAPNQDVDYFRAELGL